MKFSENSSSKLFSFLPLIMCLTLLQSTGNADLASELGYSNNNTIINSSSSSLSSCPDPSTIYFGTLAFSHKIRVTYAGSYTVESWGVSNSHTTQLDYDGGDWAYYHNFG